MSSRFPESATGAVVWQISGSGRVWSNRNLAIASFMTVLMEQFLSFDRCAMLETMASGILMVIILSTWYQSRFWEIKSTEILLLFQFQNGTLLLCPFYDAGSLDLLN